MQKRIIMISIFYFLLVLLAGCDKNNNYKAVFQGETENWKAEIRCLEDSNFENMTQYYFTLSYKNNLDELTSLDRISVGYLWLSKDSQVVSNELYLDILNYSYEDIRDKVKYTGKDEEPKRIFDFFKSEIPVWEDSVDNKEFTVAFIMSNELFDKMASDIEFIVEWGNNKENFKLLKID